MRIQFKMEGGIASFPGLSKPITIDSDQLPQQESDELKRSRAMLRALGRQKKPRDNSKSSKCSRAKNRILTRCQLLQRKLRPPKC